MSTIEDARAALDGLPEPERLRVAREALASLPPPEGAQLGRLWYILITGLFVGAILAGGAAFTFYQDNNKDAGAIFLAITTTIVGALVGLLSPSPVAT